MNYKDYFEFKARTCGHKFICLKDEAPEELQQLMYDIHTDLFDALPHDWVYQVIYDAFEDLSLDKIEDINIESDIWDSDLLEWLKMPGALTYCQRYCDEFGV